MVLTSGMRFSGRRGAMRMGGDFYSSSVNTVFEI